MSAWNNAQTQFIFTVAVAVTFMHETNKPTTNEKKISQLFVKLSSFRVNGMAGVAKTCFCLLFSTYVLVREYVCIIFDWMCVFFAHDSASTTNNNNKEASCWICLARLEWICDFPTKHTAKRRRRSTEKKDFLSLAIAWRSVRLFVKYSAKQKKKLCVFSLLFQLSFTW